MTGTCRTRSSLCHADYRKRRLPDRCRQHIARQRPLRCRRADLSVRLDNDFGNAERRRYWSIYDIRRKQLGYADYLGALQEFRTGSDNVQASMRMSAFLLDYPFDERLYPSAIAAIEHLRTMGSTVILSDGDIVFQPRKIQCAGLWDAVESRVLVHVHKECRR